MRFAALSLDTARLVAGTVDAPASLDGGIGTGVTAGAGSAGKADRR
ncbi:hypothetical protein [Streptosporangium sp. NPDC023615]